MVTIDLNDEKTKLKLLSILYSNYNGDIPNNEVEEEVNKQLDNSNTDPIVLRAINSSELNNKRIAIKVLSNEEYSNYIIKGTADGSIIANSDNVYHNAIISTKRSFLNWNNASYNYIKLTFPEGFNYDNSTVVPGSDFYTHTTSMNHYSELLSSNKTNINTIWTFLQIGLYCSNDRKSYSTNKVDIQNQNINKSLQKFNSSVQASAYNGYTTQSLTINYSIIVCFRPAFVIKDNNKSNNIFY